MRIRCPSCSATYEVPDALLDPPRTVRCARCAEDWMAVPIDEAATPEVPAEATPDPAEHASAELAVSAPVPGEEEVTGDTPLSGIEPLSLPADLSHGLFRRDSLLTAAWAASFAILTALAVAGYTERDLLMRHWPASKRVYGTLGLAPIGGKADEMTAEPKPGDAKPGEVTGAAPR